TWRGRTDQPVLKIERQRDARRNDAYAAACDPMMGSPEGPSGILPTLTLLQPVKLSPKINAVSPGCTGCEVQNGMGDVLPGCIEQERPQTARDTKRTGERVRIIVASFWKAAEGSCPAGMGIGQWMCLT
ncbi:MAG: hypothetical protein M3Y56_17105, partial [Armatimonadota bacterium]|nr:hypothetical protein [Armatimonadota bacterium]